MGPELENGNRTLVLVSDNNFNDTQISQVIVVEVTAWGVGHRGDTHACARNRETAAADAGWPSVDVPLTAAVAFSALSHQDERREASADQDHEPNRQGNPHERSHVEAQRVDSGDPLHVLDQFFHTVPSFIAALKLS